MCSPDLAPATLVLYPDGKPLTTQVRRTALWRLETSGRLALPLPYVDAEVDRDTLLTTSLALPTRSYATVPVSAIRDHFDVHTATDLTNRVDVLIPDLTEPTVDTVWELFVEHWSNPALRARPWHPAASRLPRRGFDPLPDLTTDFTSVDSDGTLWARTDWFEADSGTIPSVGETVIVGREGGANWHAYVEMRRSVWLAMRLTDLIA